MSFINLTDGIKCDREELGTCNTIMELKVVQTVKDKMGIIKFILFYQCGTCGSTILVDPTVEDKK